MISAQDPAQALQRKYDGIKDFSAEFTQTYRGGGLKKKSSSKGASSSRSPARCAGNTLPPSRSCSYPTV